MDLPKIEGDYGPLVARGISEEVCKRYHYMTGKVPKNYPVSDTSSIGKMKGKTVHIENYYDEENNLTAQKLRDKEKNFAVIGKLTTQMFGMHTIKGGGKAIVITEGAIDTLSYADMRKNWPVISITNGAQAAPKDIKANLKKLEQFEKVIFCFDNDDEGRKATEACKGILSPGKMYVANLPAEYKDLNEALMEGDWKAALNAINEAQQVRPDGIVDIADIIEEAMTPPERGLPWFIPELTDVTYGRRYGEIYGLGAGTGIGKTDVFTEQIAYDVRDLKLPVGVLYLEQRPPETAKRIAGKIANKRFHVPDGSWEPEELRKSLTDLTGQITFYDSFGQTEWSGVKAVIRHMFMTKGIRLFYVDHLTAMADTNDERGSLEQIMKELAGIANELQIIVHFISHLATPDGTPHEEGGRVAIRHFKGSRAIGFWSYFMFGLERDQQSDDPFERSITTFRILKDRYTGQSTGLTFSLGYNADTGRIILPSQIVHPIDTDSKEEQF